MLRFDISSILHAPQRKKFIFPWEGVGCDPYFKFNSTYETYLYKQIKILFPKFIKIATQMKNFTFLGGGVGRERGPIFKFNSDL